MTTTTTRVDQDAGRLEANIGFLAARFAHVTAKIGNAVLEGFGLSTRPYSVLEIVVGGPRSQREIGRILWIDPSRVLRIVDQLADSGLVERVRDDADRRITLIHATGEGRRRAEAAAAALDAAYVELLDTMPETDRGTLGRLLREGAAAGPL